MKTLISLRKFFFFKPLDIWGWEAVFCFSKTGEELKPQYLFPGFSLGGLNQENSDWLCHVLALCNLLELVTEESEFFCSFTVQRLPSKTFQLCLPLIFLLNTTRDPL